MGLDNIGLLDHDYSWKQDKQKGRNLINIVFNYHVPVVCVRTQVWSGGVYEGWI